MTATEAQKIRDNADELVNGAQVAAALTRMAAEITACLHDKNPILLCVMNGGLITTGQLVTQLDFPLQVEYIHVTRYGDRTEGERLQWVAKPAMDLRGRTVLLVDDILDEGITLKEIADYCRQQGAAQVLMAVLVEKLHHRKVIPGMRADFWGIEVGDRFLFGYGLDYKGYWRNAPGIYAVGS